MKSVNHNLEFSIISIWGFLPHVAVQRDHIQVKHVSRITKNRRWFMGGLYTKKVSFEQLISLY